MALKVFNYKATGFRVTYVAVTIFFLLAGIWLTLAPLLVEVKEGSLLIIYTLSAFCLLLTWAHYRVLLKIIGYENLAKGKRVVLDTYSRLIRVEHNGRSIEFYPRELHMVRIYESTASHLASSYFSYMILELKNGSKVLITKNTASEYDLMAGLYKVRRNRVKKWGHPVPRDMEVWL